MSEKNDPRHGIEEYREIGVNWRYWGEVRSKQMTVYFTATGALVAAAFSRGWRTPPDEGAIPLLPLWASELALAAIGIALSVAFLILEERATYYRRAFMSCAKALESDLLLPSRQYARTWSPIWVDSGTVYRFLLTTVIAFWTLCGGYALEERDWTWLFAGGVGATTFVVMHYLSYRWRKQADMSGRGEATKLSPRHRHVRGTTQRSTQRQSRHRE